jgi:hypothetical protein
MLAITAALVFALGAQAQTFRRAAACPGLVCVYPPDQTDFIASQTFDIRVEAHAPVNGSEAYNGGQVDTEIDIRIGGEGSELIPLAQFFGRAEPAISTYNFSYFEDLFARDSGARTPVNVAAKSYRNLQLNQPGKYKVVVTTKSGLRTEACWEVKPVTKAKAKNMIVFIGDGMATSMISAARLLAHKTINGKYQSTLKLDEA